MRKFKGSKTLTVTIASRILDATRPGKRSHRDDHACIFPREEKSCMNITVIHSQDDEWSAEKCNDCNRCDYDNQRDSHSARSMSIILGTIMSFH